MEMDYTRKFSIQNEKDPEIKEILSCVYSSLQEKGYNPINQIVGYILSEDPTYITNYNNARALIRKLDRDELLQECACAHTPLLFETVPRFPYTPNRLSASSTSWTNVWLIWVRNFSTEKFRLMVPVMRLPPSRMGKATEASIS